MIDIVTINKNNKEGLVHTIKSVVNQTFFDRINYIIIDGGSTDGSKEVIEQYQDKLTYWCSEPDKGIFNAMNKSIPYLTGSHVLYLNSGDYLHNNKTIEGVYELLDKDIVYGNEIFEGSANSWTSKYPDSLDEGFFRRSALPHQSTFISVNYIKEHNYDESLRIAGDWTLLREACMKYGASYKHVPMIISHYKTGGISGREFATFQKEKNDYYNFKING